MKINETIEVERRGVEKIEGGLNMKKMLLLCMVGIFLSLVLSGCFLLSPSKPTNVSLTAGYRNISITWTDNASNESSYEIEYSVDGTNFYSLVSLPQNSTSYNHTNLNYNYTYSYKVGAKNQFGITWSDVVSKKPLGPATVSGKIYTYIGQTAFTQSAEFPVVEIKNSSRERYKANEIIGDILPPLIEVRASRSIAPLR